MQQLKKGSFGKDLKNCWLYLKKWIACYRKGVFVIDFSSGDNSQIDSRRKFALGTQASWNSSGRCRVESGTAFFLVAGVHCTIQGEGVATWTIKHCLSRQLEINVSSQAFSQDNRFTPTFVGRQSRALTIKGNSRGWNSNANRLHLDLIL